MNVHMADRFHDFRMSASPSAAGFGLWIDGDDAGTATVDGDAITITLGDLAGVVALDGTVRSATSPMTGRALDLTDLRRNILTQAAYAVTVAR